jgi:hypothetical protein
MGPLAPKSGVVCTPCHDVFGTFQDFSMYAFELLMGGTGLGPLPRL